MLVKVAPPLGRLGAMMAAITVLRGALELGGDARGRASRIDEEGEDEDQCHEPFYSSARVRIEG
jgi:hypothetical protein